MIRTVTPMIRAEQHLIDERGELQMRGALSQTGWGINRIEKDYGIDFDIQVFEKSRPTGVWFKVQLKSSGATKYSVRGEFLSEQLDMAHALHYSSQMNDPVILIHADVKNERTYWCAPQLDEHLGDKIRNQEGQECLSIRIPTRNELPNTIDELIVVIGSIKLLLATRNVVDAPVPEFLASIRNHVDEEEVLRELRNKSDAVRLQQIQSLFVNGKYEEGLARINKVLTDPDACVENKFWALLEEERIKWRKAVESDVPQGLLPNIHLETSRKLQELTSKGPAALKFYALIARKAAELEILCQKSIGLFMNLRQQQHQHNAFGQFYALTELAETEKRVWQKYNQCVRLAQYSANSRYRSALPRALLRIVEASATSLILLRSSDRVKLADAYARSALQICKLAAWISRQEGDDTLISYAVTTAILTTGDGEGEAVAWAIETMKTISDPEIRKDTERRLGRALSRLRGESVEGDKPATAQQVYENMATGLGLDLSDPTNPLTIIFRKATEDADPSRILRDCEQVFVTLGRPSSAERIIRESLNLPAGSKIIHCELNGHAVQGESLDIAYSQFKTHHCDTCPDRVPRPPEWAYTEEWRETENERLRPFMEKFWARRRDK
ncbi:MAG: DUF4365 domain-containing protein [Candidatus Acidiferrales bacterium]